MLYIMSFLMCVVVINVIMLNCIILSVIMLIVVVLSVIKLIVVPLSVFMLRVVAPLCLSLFFSYKVLYNKTFNCHNKCNKLACLSQLYTSSC
jgi:hypothetical protein